MHFAVLELLLPGIAIKKDAVCLASWDPNQVHVQVPNSVNASINLNKRQEDVLGLVYCNYWGTQILGRVSLDNETFIQKPFKGLSKYY